MKAHFFLTAAIVGLLPACATVTKGTTDEAYVRSEPKGAKVTTDLGFHGITPANIVHKRKKTYTITVEKTGYKPIEIFIDNRLEGTGVAGVAGNVVLGGVVGLVVDGVSGAALDHYPADVFVELELEESPKESVFTALDTERTAKKAVEDRTDELVEDDI